MTPPKRQLGLAVAAAIVIANMIGTGVFTSIGFQAHDLHDPMTILIAWIVGGVLALCGAAVYAELGSLMPRAGGEYVYLTEAYSPAVGFMSGWVSLTAGFSAPIAVAALAFSDYFGRLVDVPQDAWLSFDYSSGGHHVVGLTLGPSQYIAIGLIIAVACLHAFDTKIGGRVQAVFTAAKVLLISGFIIFGLVAGHGDWSHFQSYRGGLSNIGTPEFAGTLLYVNLAYSGWNAAAYIAGDIEKPEKTLPRALLLGTGAVMVLYVLLNLVFLYAVPTDAISGPYCVGDHCVNTVHGVIAACKDCPFAPGSPGNGPVVEVGATAATALFGTGVGNLITALIALALISAVSAMVMAGPRVYAAMAADRALPQALATHTRRGVPANAVVLQAVLAILFVLVGDLGQLMRFVSFTLAISAALTVGSLFILRRRKERAAYRTFGYPLTPLAFIALSAWIVYLQITANPWESAAVAVLFAVGATIYMVTQRGRGRL